MLTGAKVVYKGFSSFMAVADVSSIAMEESIAAIVEDGKYFKAVNQVSAMDIIKNPNDYKGLKRPLTMFTFVDESDCDKFIEEYGIKSLLKNKLDWEQEKMFMEDQVQADQDTDEIASMEEIATGKKSTNMTIGSLYGIDKEDPWDTRTEQEKAEDLMSSAGMINKLVADGILTDEAMAPTFEQNIDSQKLALIDPDNIPEFLEAQFKEQNLDERDIQEAIKQMNENIEKQNALIDEGITDPEERIKRIVGDFTPEGNGSMFINKDSLNSGGNKPSNKETGSTSDKKPSSIIDQMKSTGFSSDDVKDILKPSTIDGKKITDFGQYVYDNTTMDEYDLKEAIDEMKDSGVSETTTDISELPENIGSESDIKYTSDTKTFDIKAIRVSEHDEVFIAKLPDLDAGEIVGTSNVKVYSVVNNVLAFIPNRINDSHVIIVFDNDGPDIYKIGM